MAQTEDLLVVHGLVVTLDDSDLILEDGAVLISGDRIVALGATDELRRKNPDARLIDAAHRVVMPGFINAHMHLYSTLSVGLAAKPAPDFLGILEQLWWKLDRALTPDSLRGSAMIPLAEGLLRGTTTVIDHHASPSCISGSLLALEQAARTAGVRVNLCYEVSDRGGEEEVAAGLRENQRHLERCRANADKMVTGSFGLHASFTVSDATLRRAVDLARGLDAGFHVHVAEDVSDQTDSLTRSGKRVVERFHEAGILGPRTIAAHAVHVDARERALLAETGTIVVTNPQSNMNNAVGATDVLGLLSEGVTMGLGTDGMTNAMLDEVRALPLIQRHVHGDPRVAFGEAAELLLKGNAKVASALFDDTLGVLTAGALADLVVTDYIPFTALTAQNLAGHLLFGVARSRVDTTIVDGRVRVRRGQLIDVDDAEIRRDARAAAAEVWRRFEG